MELQAYLMYKQLQQINQFKHKLEEIFMILFKKTMKKKYNKNFVNSK